MTEFVAKAMPPADPVIAVPRELLAVMYDLAINSLDFGSNFWGFEEHQAAQQVAKLLGVEYPRCNEWIMPPGYVRKAGDPAPPRCAQPKGHAAAHKPAAQERDPDGV